MGNLTLSLIEIIFSPLSYIIAIIVVVVILVNNDKKKKATQVAAPAANNNAEVQNQAPAPQPVAPPKPKNPMAKWNWLLYIGSVLIVLAMIYFVDSVDDSAVAPTTIILTLIIYGAGIAIHRAIDYLRPVGKAFIYSALCMIPIWLISLEAIKVPSEVIPLIVSFSFMVASFLATLTVKASAMGYAAFLSPIAFIWSFYSLFEKQLSIDAAAYFTFLAPMVTALLPLAFWLTKPKWLPVAFRHASMGLGLVLIPFTYVCSLVLFLIPNIANSTPLLRVLCAAFMLVYALGNWYKTKKHGFFVVLRFTAQVLIIAAVCDALNFSLISFSFFDKKIDYTAALVCAIVWLLTFLAQVIYSLYARTETDKEKALERTVGILSIVGIFITPLLCSNFERIPYAIVWLVICVVTAVLGVLHAIRYKNVLWSIATVASILIAPLIFGINIMTPAWDEATYMVCYTLINAAFLLGYDALSRIQKKEAATVGIIALSLSSLIILANAMSIELAWLGYGILAVFFAAFAIISKIKALYEVVIYSGALCLFDLSGKVYDAMASKIEPEDVTNFGYRYYYYSPEAELLRVSLAAVRAHIISASIFLTNWVYERNKQPNKQVRFIFAYILFSLTMTFSCLSQDAIGWSIFFLIEQVAFLLVAIVSKRTWLVWFSSIEIFITALSLTGGFNYIWLGIIGVGLIAIVVWQLKKNNDKLKRAEVHEPIAPVEQIEPQSEESKEPEEVKEEAPTEEPEEEKEPEDKPEEPEDKGEDEAKSDSEPEQKDEEPEKESSDSEKPKDEGDHSEEKE